MSGEYARRYATMRVDRRPFEMRLRAELDRYPRPPPALVGHATSLSFELNPEGPGRALAIELELLLDPDDFAQAVRSDIFGLGTTGLDDASAITASTTTIALRLRAELTPTSLRRFSGLDLTDDMDLREAFASVLGDSRGNIFHAVESWRAVAVRPGPDPRPSPAEGA